jgi:hypothetical protein
MGSYLLQNNIGFLKDFASFSGENAESKVDFRRNECPFAYFSDLKSIKNVRQDSWFLSCLPHDFRIPLPVHRQKKRVASNWIYAVPATRCILMIAPGRGKRKGRNRKNSPLQIGGNFGRISIGRDRLQSKCASLLACTFFIFRR